MYTPRDDDLGDGNGPSYEDISRIFTLTVYLIVRRSLRKESRFEIRSDWKKFCERKKDEEFLPRFPDYLKILYI